MNNTVGWDSAGKQRKPSPGNFSADTNMSNWLSTTYLGNPHVLQAKTNSPLVGLICLLIMIISGPTGITIGSAAMDLGMRNTDHVV